MNRSTDADGIFLNLIKDSFGELSDILRYVFDFSLQNGIFADPLKIAKVTPVFRTGKLRKLVISIQFMFCNFSRECWNVSCTTAFIAT